MAESLTEPYFAYGSNLSAAFLQERLKDGEWLPDGWHKSGQFQGPAPVDHGTYVLDDYEFGYTLDQGAETTGNVVPKQGAHVYGVVYSLSTNQLKELDATEDVPRDYLRVAAKVHKFADEGFKTRVVNAWEDAWVYVGNSTLVTEKLKPDPEYVDLLVSSATERGFPQDYVNHFLKVDK